MKLENQVCNLEWSQTLEKLGVKQESLFVYYGGALYYRPHIDGRSMAGKRGVSAFTVAELGEMLPDRTPNQDSDKGLYPYDFVNWPMPCPMNKWKGYILKANGNTIHRSLVIADTEADARAKMLVYLLENSLIKV